MPVISSKAAAAAAEWDPMYAGGKQPFGAGPFAGVDGLLRKWVKAGGTVLDVGAGYGRDSLWMARELSCIVTAVEPGQSGVDAMSAAARRGEASPGSVDALTCCASEFDFSSHAATFDAVVMDSVLQFITPDLRASVMRGVCGALRPAGTLIVIGWPNEDDPSWVSKLIVEAAGGGIAIAVDADKLECDAVFDGEETHMEWSVTVAKASFPIPTEKA